MFHPETMGILLVINNIGISHGSMAYRGISQDLREILVSLTKSPS